MTIITWTSPHTHRVTLLEADVAITRCGMRIEQAGQLMRAARGLERAKPCKNCNRELRV